MFNQRKCFIECCENKKNIRNKIRLFRFPKLLKSCTKLEKLSRLRQKKWKIAIKGSAIRNNNLLTKYCVVCSDHFMSGEPAKILDLNNVDWVPTLNLQKSKICKSKINNLKNVPNSPDIMEEFSIESIVFDTNYEFDSAINLEINKFVQVIGEINYSDPTQTET